MTTAEPISAYSNLFAVDNRPYHTFATGLSDTFAVDNRLHHTFSTGLSDTFTIDNRWIGLSGTGCSNTFTIDNSSPTATTVKWDYGYQGLLKAYGSVGFNLFGIGLNGIEVYGGVKGGRSYEFELTGSGADSTLVAKRRNRLGLFVGHDLGKAEIGDLASFTAMSAQVEGCAAAGYDYEFHPLSSDEDALLVSLLVLDDGLSVGAAALPVVGPFISGILTFLGGDNNLCAEQRTKRNMEVGVLGKVEAMKLQVLCSSAGDDAVNLSAQPNGLLGGGFTLKGFSWQREGEAPPAPTEPVGGIGLEASFSAAVSPPGLTVLGPVGGTYQVGLGYESRRLATGRGPVIAHAKYDVDFGLPFVQIHRLDDYEVEFSREAADLLVSEQLPGNVVQQLAVQGAGLAPALNLLGFDTTIKAATGAVNGRGEIVLRHYAEDGSLVNLPLRSPKLGAAFIVGGGVQIGLDVSVGWGKRWLERSSDLRVVNDSLVSLNDHHYARIPSEWEGEAGIISFHEQVLSRAWQAAESSILGFFKGVGEWVDQQSQGVVQAAQGAAQVVADKTTWLQGEVTKIKIDITSWVPDIPSLIQGTTGSARLSMAQSDGGPRIESRPYTSSKFALLTDGAAARRTVTTGGEAADVLSVLGSVQRVRVTDQDGNEITQFPDASTMLDFRISDDMLLHAGFVPSDADRVLIFRFKPEDGKWYEVASTRATDPQSGEMVVSASIAQPGDYAAAIIGLPVDATSPTASIVSPQSEAAVAGTVMVSGTCEDDRGVASITLNLDNTVVGYPTINGSAWTCSVDTTRLASGHRTLTVIAADASGNSGSASLQVFLNNSPTNTMGSVKYAAQSTVSLEDVVVTADAYDLEGCFYVEDSYVPAGIRVVPLGAPAIEGDLVRLAGVLQVSDGECQIGFADVFVVSGGNAEPRPLGLGNLCLGGGPLGFQPGMLAGAGLNNVGLLVRTWGKVTQVGEGYLYVDDGSGLRDGTSTGAEENVGVRVICDPTDYSPGDFVVVTGISSCFKTPSDTIARRILTRKPEDLRKLTGP